MFRVRTVSRTRVSLRPSLRRCSWWWPGPIVKFTLWRTESPSISHRASSAPPTPTFRNMWVTHRERERERESLITCVVKWKFLVGTIYSCRNTYILYIGPTKTFPFLTGWNSLQLLGKYQPAAQLSRKYPHSTVVCPEEKIQRNST